MFFARLNRGGSGNNSGNIGWGGWVSGHPILEKFPPKSAKIRIFSYPFLSLLETFLIKQTDCQETIHYSERIYTHYPHTHPLYATRDWKRCKEIDQIWAWNDCCCQSLKSQKLTFEQNIRNRLRIVMKPCNLIGEPQPSYFNIWQGGNLYIVSPRNWSGMDGSSTKLGDGSSASKNV